MLYLIEIIKRIINTKLKMLGGNFICNINSKKQIILGNNYFSVIVDRSSRNFGTGKERNLCFKFVAYSLCKVLVIRYKNRTCHLVMLGLRKKICGNEFRIACCIGNNKNFARTGNHVY